MATKTQNPAAERLLDLAARPARALDSLGEQMRFYVRSLAWSGRTLRRYK
jgi:phospholipid/cholesterol/gamma-HCH transport system permease protein